MSWPEWVSTIIPPKEGELENGTYRPSLAPVNFKQSKLGTKYFTVWYAGPLSINNHRGELQFIPSNLQQFTAADPKAGNDVPANPSLPDYQRDVQFTVNGQFQPIIKSKAGQTEIWVLANASDGTVILFPGYEGNVNVAMGDVDGDGILDLIVGVGKDHAPEVVVYAGASIRGKGTFGTELARF